MANIFFDCQRSLRTWILRNYKTANSLRIPRWQTEFSLYYKIDMTLCNKKLEIMI